MILHKVHFQLCNMANGNGSSIISETKVENMSFGGNGNYNSGKI